MQKTIGLQPSLNDFRPQIRHELVIGSPKEVIYLASMLTRIKLLTGMLPEATKDKNALRIGVLGAANIVLILTCQDSATREISL
jgi:hypothetical protein